MTRFLDAQARKRSHAGHKAKAAGNVVVIEGESVTPDEIASRLGITRDAVSKRLRKAQALPGVVTWESLRGKA